MNRLTNPIFFYQNLNHLLVFVISVCDIISYNFYGLYFSTKGMCCSNASATCNLSKFYLFINLLTVFTLSTSIILFEFYGKVKDKNLKILDIMLIFVKN